MKRNKTERGERSTAGARPRGWLAGRLMARGAAGETIRHRGDGGGGEKDGPAAAEEEPSASCLRFPRSAGVDAAPTALNM